MRKDLNTRNREKYAHAFKDTFESMDVAIFSCHPDTIYLNFAGEFNQEQEIIEPSLLTVESEEVGLLGVIRLDRYYREDFINLENSLKEHSILMTSINGSDIEEQDINMYKPINLYMAQAIALYNDRTYIDNIGDIYINYCSDNGSYCRLIACDTNDTTSCLETFALCVERIAAILRSICYCYKEHGCSLENYLSLFNKFDDGNSDFSEFLINYIKMINKVTDNAEVTSVSPYDKITMKIIETPDEEETSCGCNCCNCNDCDCNDCDEMYSGDDCDYCDGCDGCDCECFDHCDGCVRDNSEDEDDFYDDFEFEDEDEFEDDFDEEEDDFDEEELDEEELDEEELDEEDKEENVFERVFIAENPNIHFEEQTNKPDTKNKKKSTDKSKKSSCKQEDTEKNIGIQVGNAKVEAHITDGAIAIKVTGDIPSSIDDIDKFIRNLIEKI